MLHLRLISPANCTPRGYAHLTDHPGVTNSVVLRAAGRQHEGGLLLADVAREATNDVLGEFRAIGLDERGSIAVEEVDLSLSRASTLAEQLALGEGSDAVVWEDLEARTREDSSLTGAYLVLFAVATMLRQCCRRRAPARAREVPPPNASPKP